MTEPTTMTANGSPRITSARQLRDLLGACDALRPVRVRQDAAPSAVRSRAELRERLGVPAPPPRAVQAQAQRHNPIREDAAQTVGSGPVRSSAELRARLARLPQ